MNWSRVTQFGLYIFKAVLRDNIGLLAAAIAFFGFSAMIPLVLLVVYVASIFIPHAEIQQFMMNVLKSYVPSLPDAKLVLTQTITRLTELGSKVGWISILGLLWTTIGGFVSFQQTLDLLWEVHQRRSFIKQFFVGFAMLGFLLILTIVSSLTAAISPTIIQTVFQNSSFALRSELIRDISRILYPLLLFITCYFCYRVLPSKPIQNLYLVIGSLISTIAIYISRVLFVWSTSHLGQYELIYGSLTFVILLVTWIYIASVIVLFGAEIAKALDVMNKQRQDEKHNLT